MMFSIVILTPVLVPLSHGCSASGGLPWQVQRDNNGDGATIEGSVFSSIFNRHQIAAQGKLDSTEAGPSKSHVAKTQPEHDEHFQSLFGRKETNTDNPDGVVVKVDLLSELQVEPSLAQITNKQRNAWNMPFDSELQQGKVKSSAGSAPARTSDDHPSGEDWKWRVAWESAGDIKSRTVTAAPGRSAVRSSAKGGMSPSRREETENSSELRVLPLLRGHNEPMLSRKRSDMDNPDGAVVDVILNSELQESDGSVQPAGVNMKRSLAQVADEEAGEMMRTSGHMDSIRFLKPVGTGTRRALTQYADADSDAHGWPWASVWNSAGDIIGGGLRPSSSALERSAGKGTHAVSDNTANTELRAGDHDQWTLGRKPSSTDNPKGAVMGVTLNSELQEESSAADIFDVHGEPTLTQLSDDRSTANDWPWNSANHTLDKDGNSTTHTSTRSTSNKKSELSAGQPGHHQWSLGRKQNHTDNPKGAVMQVTLNSELQEESGAVELSSALGQQPSLAQVLLDTRSTTRDWPWNAARRKRRTSGSSRARTSTHSTSNKKSELSAGQPGHRQWSLGRKQNDTDNPEGAVMKVTLNSELQEGSGSVEHFGLLGQPPSAQMSDVRSTAKDWPWHRASHKPSKSSTSTTHALTHSTSKKFELSAGQPGHHQWSLHRKQNHTDNPKGAVMEVTLNSELQEGSDALEFPR